jgi:hypothetical protein
MTGIGQHSTAVVGQKRKSPRPIRFPVSCHSRSRLLWVERCTVELSGKASDMPLTSSESAVFQERRRATWQAIRWWLAIAVLTIASLLVLPFTDASSNRDRHFEVGICLIFLFTVCAFAIRHQVRRLYRCPNCNQVPIKAIYGWRDEFGTTARDVQWNPVECPSCGAALR